LNSCGRTVAILEIDVNSFRSTAAAVALLAAATSTGLAQHASPTAAVKPKPAVASQSATTVAHPTIAPAPAVVAPARNAIGLPTPKPAANNVGAVHGPGQVGPNVNAAKPGALGIGGIGSATPHAPTVPLTAKGTLSGSQMGRPATGGAMLGGGATHAPSAVIGHNVSTKR
jgi:hypothetical protein